MLRRCLAVAVFVILTGPALAADSGPLQFQITFEKNVSAEPFSGRLFVMLSRRMMETPRPGPAWFNTEPIFAIDMKDWKPGSPAVLGAELLGYPVALSKVPSGTYYSQAIMDFDRGSPNLNAEGNGYSRPVKLEHDPAKAALVKLTIDQVARERRFVETERVKLVDIESKLLTAFHGRPTRLRAGVVLPASFKDAPEKKYPALYDIPGFGGTHFGALRGQQRNVTDIGGVEMLYVVLDPRCRWGHSVFADSDTNGPWGKALTEELIPYIEREYRAVSVPTARFLTGHSSGGWSSLWLQVAYPDFFGGTWSTAPDPADFRDFQRINIYKPGTNMFIDAQGKQRPLARRGGEPILFYKPFSDMEVVMGHGGQLGSFEAVFSPRGPNGRPKQLWNRSNGEIDPEVAKSWERYDIRLVLERNWQTLGPKLAGKLHVYMGAEDTFYLDGATILLKESLARLGSDAKVEIFPGKDHGSLMDRPMRDRIHREMAEQFRKHHQQ